MLNFYEWKVLEISYRFLRAENLISRRNGMKVEDIQVSLRNKKTSTKNLRRVKIYIDFKRATKNKRHRRQAKHDHVDIV